MFIVFQETEIQSTVSKPNPSSYACAVGFDYTKFSSGKDYMVSLIRKVGQIKKAIIKYWLLIAGIDVNYS